MALIVWDGSLTVGVTAIDSDHQRLVAYVNQLHEAMQAGRGRDVVGGVLKRLLDYTRTHFATEERLMQLHGYPHAEPHRIQHQTLVKEVVELERRFADGEAALTMKVMTMLKDWLSHHIQGSDKALGAFLKQRAAA